MPPSACNCRLVPGGTIVIESGNPPSFVCIHTGSSNASRRVVRRPLSQVARFVSGYLPASRTEHAILVGSQQAIAPLRMDRTGVPVQARQAGTLGRSFRANPSRHLFEYVARDVHASIAQRQEEDVTLAGISKPIRHERME